MCLSVLILSGFLFFIFCFVLFLVLMRFFFSLYIIVFFLLFYFSFFSFFFSFFQIVEFYLHFVLIFLLLFPLFFIFILLRDTVHPSSSSYVALTEALKGTRQHGTVKLPFKQNTKKSFLLFSLTHLFFP